MKRMPVTIAMAAAAVIAASSASAITVRPKADLRIWQTAMSPSAPLSWPWEKGADSATVAISNRMTGATASATVSKGVGDLRGEYAPPPLPSGAEAFYAVELTLLAGETPVAAYSADVAYVNGVSGRGCDVQEPGSKAWRSVRSARLAAYDSAWLDETANAMSVALSAAPAAGGEAVVSATLPPASGYTVIPALSLGDYTFGLGFDSEPDVWSATLKCGIPGMALVFR